MSRWFSLVQFSFRGVVLYGKVMLDGKDGCLATFTWTQLGREGLLNRTNLDPDSLACTREDVYCPTFANITRQIEKCELVPLQHRGE